MMVRCTGKPLLVLFLVSALISGMISPAASVAEAKGSHGTVSGIITEEQLKNTPPSPDEYSVNMGTQGSAKDGRYDAWFLKDDIQTVRIEMDDVNLNYMLQNATDKPTVMTKKVTIGDQTVCYTGLKTKGNYTLARTDESDSDRFSFTINFGKYIKKKKGYEATQNFYGCNKISFNNFFFDKTMMKEYLALKLMTEMGVPTPQYGLAKLYINNEYYGVYFMVEAVDSSVLEQYLGQGSAQISDYLTKPEGTRLHYDEGLRIYKAADGSFTLDSLSPALAKNAKGDYVVDESSLLAGQSGLWEDDPDTLKDVAEMIPTVLTWEERLNLLSRGKDFSGKAVDVNSSRYLELLGQIMDVDEVVRYFAVHSFIIQMDNMFNQEQNFGLYVDRSGKSLLIPWDYDLGWGCFHTPFDAESVANWDVDKMFTPDLIQGSADSVYSDFPLFYVIYQNRSLMEKYHQYMKDCSLIASLGGKTSTGTFYDAGRFAAAIDVLMPKLQAAASEKLADHVYYMDHERERNRYRQCNQPSSLLRGLPNLSKVVAGRAVGVFSQISGIQTTVCGYGCDMSTIGNAGTGRPSNGGNLTIIDDKTGIFATAEYAQNQMWNNNAAGPSLTVSKLSAEDEIFKAVKKKTNCDSDQNMEVYHMTNTKEPFSSYRIYIPVSSKLAPGQGQTTCLYSYSDSAGTVSRLTETKLGSLYSAETSSIEYIAVIKRTSSDKKVTIPSVKVGRPARVKSLKVKNMKKKKVKLTWSKTSGAKGYQIQYSLKRKFPSGKTEKKNTQKKKYTIKKLTKKKVYFFRVRAYRKDTNGDRIYGKWSKVVRVKIRK